MRFSPHKIFFIDKRGSFCQYIKMSRVDRFLPILWVEVCFLCLPPGLLAVPYYVNPVSVDPGVSHH